MFLNGERTFEKGRWGGKWGWGIERARGEKGQRFGTSKADLQSPLWDWLYTTGIPVLVSTGNCHLLGATSFVPLLLSSLTLTLSLFLSHSQLMRSVLSSLPNELSPETILEKPRHERELFRKHFTVESSRLVRNQRILLFIPLLSSLQHFPFFLPIPIPHTTHPLWYNDRAKNYAIEKSEYRSRRNLYGREYRLINASTKYLIYRRNVRFCLSERGALKMRGGNVGCQ